MKHENKQERNNIKKRQIRLNNLFVLYYFDMVSQWCPTGSDVRSFHVECFLPVNGVWHLLELGHVKCFYLSQRSMKNTGDRDKTLVDRRNKFPMRRNSFCIPLYFWHRVPSGFKSHNSALLLCWPFPPNFRLTRHMNCTCGRCACLFSWGPLNAPTRRSDILAETDSVG